MKDFGSAAKTVEGNEGTKCKHSTRLDTYGCGCAHDCKYCYAKSLLDFRKLWNPEAPAVGDIKKIAAQVKRLPREVVRLGGMTDCFQPAERLHGVTYKTIKLLNRRHIQFGRFVEFRQLQEQNGACGGEGGDVLHVQDV